MHLGNIEFKVTSLDDTKFYQFKIKVIFEIFSETMSRCQNLV